MSPVCPHFLNQAPPRAQQLRFPAFLLLPHLGHAGLRIFDADMSRECVMTPDRTMLGMSQCQCNGTTEPMEVSSNPTCKCRPWKCRRRVRYHRCTRRNVCQKEKHSSEQRPKQHTTMYNSLSTYEQTAAKCNTHTHTHTHTGRQKCWYCEIMAIFVSRTAVKKSGRVLVGSLRVSRRRQCSEK